MEEQHKKIKGYRELSRQKIDDINDIKGEGERLRKVIEIMRSRGDSLDQKWVSIAETHLQQGIMAAVRAVAQPYSF